MPKHAMEMDTAGMPDFVINACAALTYVTKLEIWPEFVAWITVEHPSAIPDDFDSDRMRNCSMYNVADLILHFRRH
jgi:hypothetical protein